MAKRKYPAISIHSTLNDNIEIDWERDYDGSFRCPECSSIKFRFRGSTKGICKLTIECTACLKRTHLTCPTHRHIFRYQPGLACPNPLCNQVGPDGKTLGWIYLAELRNPRYKCYYCDTSFTPSENCKNNTGWSSRENIHLVKHFQFEDNLWDLRNFYESYKCSWGKFINFSNINPDWYQQLCKRYIHYLLKSKVCCSASTIHKYSIILKQFSEVVQKYEIQQYVDINRKIVLSFLDDCKQDRPSTLKNKISCLKLFFEWLDLNVQEIIRGRDFPKRKVSDSNWLDEPVRLAIKQCIYKLPAPIARQYQVQEYTAARPLDICWMAFNCLKEENGKWYVTFYQRKVNRSHRVPANREIRNIIEQQQQWIQQTLGKDYPYLFCHFRGIRSYSYPEFTSIKPLPEPPMVSYNPMVRVIRLLIEKENIRDANGQQPHFTGKITRPSRLQEVRIKYGMEAAQLYADHSSSTTTFQHYAPPTTEQLAQVDLPFQELLMNLDSKFLPWQSLPESLLKNPKAHELDIEIAPRLVVYGHCALDPKTPCPYHLYPKCYGCSSFRPSTGKLPLYERQYQGEQQRIQSAKEASAELAYEEAKTTIEAMDRWLPQLRRLAND